MRKLIVLLFAFLCCHSLLAQTANYAFDAQEEHSVLLILSEVWADVKEVTGELAKFNQKEFGSAGLSIQLYKMPYLSNVPVLFVSSFENKEVAMRYYQKLTNPYAKPDFMQMGIVEAVWAFSNTNFNELLLAETLEGYPVFFEAHYLSEK